MAQQRIQIVNGPSRESLFDSLRLFNERRETEFEFDNGRKIRGMVHAISVEDGSGHNWLVSFSTYGVTMKLYYNSDRRKGAVLDPGTKPQTHN